MDDGIPKGVIGAIFSKFKKFQNFLDFCFHRTERKKGKSVVELRKRCIVFFFVKVKQSLRTHDRSVPRYRLIFIGLYVQKRTRLRISTICGIG